MKVIVDGVESGFSSVININNVDTSLFANLTNIFQYIVIYGLVFIIAATNMPNSASFWSVLGILFCGCGIYLTIVIKHTTLYLILMVSIYGATGGFLIFIFVFSLVPYCYGTKSHFQLRENSFKIYTQNIFQMKPGEVVVIIKKIKVSRTLRTKLKN